MSDVIMTKVNNEKRLWENWESIPSSEKRSDSLNSSLNWILQKNHEHLISKGFCCIFKFN